MRIKEVDQGGVAHAPFISHAQHIQALPVCVSVAQHRQDRHDSLLPITAQETVAEASHSKML